MVKQSFFKFISVVRTIKNAQIKKKVDLSKPRDIKKGKGVKRFC